MEEIATNPTVELPELTQDWEIDSWRAQQNFVHQDPGERSSDPTGDCARLAVSVQEPPAEPWVGDGLLRVGTLSVAGHSWDLLKELTIIFITSTIVWPQVNSREGTQLHPSTEKWINDLLSMASPIRTRPSFPLSQSLLSGSFHRPLVLLHQRADRMKTTITAN